MNMSGGVVGERGEEKEEPVCMYVSESEREYEYVR